MRTCPKIKTKSDLRRFKLQILKWKRNQIRGELVVTSEKGAGGAGAGPQRMEGEKDAKTPPSQTAQSNHPPNLA